MKTITVRALIGRINRKLARDGMRLCVTRNPGNCSSRWRDQGRYHVVAGNWMRDKFDHDGELLGYANELGVLASGEVLEGTEVAS